MVYQILLYIFLAAVAVQVIYLLLLFIGIFQKSAKPVTSDFGVSIIVAAHNELENLKALIPKLLSQNHPNYEIIVVDDRSGDDTIELAKDPAFENVKFIRIDNTPGHIHSKKYAITIGIKQAKNPIILLTDADCHPVSNNWAEKMVQGYNASTSIVLGFGGYTASKSFLNYFIRFETLLTGLQYLGWAGLGMPYMGVGRNLSYKKEFFNEKKGFKKFQALTGGDDDLFVNQHADGRNTSMALGREALMLSEPKKAWSGYFRQKLRHLAIGKYYKKRHKVMLGIYSIAQLLIWPLFIFLLIMVPDELSLIGIGFLLRLIIMSIVMGVASRRFGHPYNILGAPLMDFCYTIYYIFVGITALFTRKVRWS